MELGSRELSAVTMIADIAHQGQERRDGRPYIDHPKEVQLITQTFYPDNIEAHILAMLHDTIEDGPKYSGLTRRKLYSMVKEAIPNNPRSQKRIMDALRIMTHSKRTHPVYEDYLALVFSNPLAGIVKISDLIHNLSNNPSAGQITKYRTALANVPIPSYVDGAHRAKLESILS